MKRSFNKTSLPHVPNPQPSGTANPVAAEGPTEVATGTNVQDEGAA